MTTSIIIRGGEKRHIDVIELLLHLRVLRLASIAPGRTFITRFSIAKFFLIVGCRNAQSWWTIERVILPLMAMIGSTNSLSQCAATHTNTASSIQWTNKLLIRRSFINKNLLSWSTLISKLFIIFIKMREREREKGALWGWITTGDSYARPFENVIRQRIVSCFCVLNAAIRKERLRQADAPHSQTPVGTKNRIKLNLVKVSRLMGTTHLVVAWSKT